MNKIKQKFIDHEDFKIHIQNGLVVRSSNEEIIVLYEVSSYNEESPEIRKVKIYNVTNNKKFEGYLYHDSVRNHVIMYIDNYSSTYIAEVISK